MPDDISDVELVQRICQGCQESLLHLVVDRCGGLLQMIAARFHYDGDLPQEVCVHLFGAGDWARLRSWNGTYLNAWVRQVATRICLNQYRSRVKYQGRFERLTEKNDSAADEDSNLAEQKMMAEVDRSKLLRACEKLDRPRDRIIIYSHCLGDLSIDDLAKTLGMSVATARVAKTRALQRLKELLQKEGADDV